jgi:hypothetical protein
MFVKKLVGLISIFLFLSTYSYGADGQIVREGSTAAAIDVTTIDMQGDSNLNGLDHIDDTTEATLESELDHDDITGAGTVDTTEEVQDTFGSMVTGNTETRITVTYQDDDGTIDFVVDAETDPNALLTIGTDNVKDTHIDWGTGASQISADDIPDGSSKGIPTLTQIGNWNTAYGWGNHASVGYLGVASTGVTGDWTINSDLANVTSTLTFGRTTGGSATINYDGTYIGFNKTITVTSPNGTLNDRDALVVGRIGTSSYLGEGLYSTADVVTGGLGKGIAFRTWQSNVGIIEPMYISHAGQVGINTTSFISTEKLRVNGDILADGNLIINGDLGDVTSTITFGRTTSGNATIDYDGTEININKSVEIIVPDWGGFTITSPGTAGFYAHPGGGGAFQIRNTADSGFVFGNSGSTHVSLNNDGQVGINTTSFIGTEKLRVNGQIYSDDNISALTFTDRTPFYEGDALTEIMKIKGKNGEIDHSTLPAFAHKTRVKNIYENIELKEIDIKNAYEITEVEQDKLITKTDSDGKKEENKIISSIIEKQDGYEIVEGKVIPKIIKKEIYEKELVKKMALKADTYFDSTEGKFYKKNDNTSEVKKVNDKVVQIIKVDEENEDQRDLGAMISILTVAVQQLKKENDAQNKLIIELEKKIPTFKQAKAVR